jgi:predicted LPLAT superfamily acyltransferase
MPTPLKESLNVATPDELYGLLIEAHQGLSEAESLKLDAKLILLLANHIGDLEVLRAAIAKAKAGAPVPRAD